MKLNKIFRQNNIWLSLTTVMAITLLLPNLSLAQVAAVLGNLVGGLLFLILFTPFIFLFEIEMVILPIIAQFNNFTRLPGIVDGWRIMRDVSNMFFIVVLLLMSFATILKMQTYGYKELLKNLIIMAILINFSKTIAGLIIDIGQVVMLTFVVAIKDVAAGNLITAFGIDELMKIDTSSASLADTAGDVTSIVLAYFLAGIMILLASVVVMVFIIMLVMRIVILWILVVVSPIAFLANTFPITKQYFNQWLSTLFKEVMIGPVLIFFLWLSLSILQTDMKTEFTATSAESVNSAAGDQLQGIGNKSIIEAGKWENILKYIISIAMLLGALKMTKSFGSMAGSVGSKFGEAAGKKIASVYYKGTSGAGGLRGGASRLAFGSSIDPVTGESKMSLVNRGLMRVGKVIPGAKQVAMLGEGMEDERTRVKRAYKEKKGAHVRDQEAFHAAGIGRYEEALKLSKQLESGKPLDEKQTKRAKELFEGEMYNKQDKERVYKQSGHAYADANGAEEIKQRFESDGIAAAAKLHAETITGEGGNKVAAEMMVQFTPAQINKFLEGLTRPQADAWKKVLGQAGIANRIKNGGVPRKKDASGNDIVDTDSVAYRAATVSHEAFEDVMSNGGLNDKEKEKLAKARTATMGEKEVLKMVPTSDSWKALTPHLTDAHMNQIAVNGSDEQVNALLENGNLTKVLDNKNIQSRTQGTDIKVQVENNIQNNMKQYGIKSASPEETKLRRSLARQNLQQAHLMFPDINQLAEFINNSGMDVNKVSQIDEASLKKIATKLDGAMQEALKKRGIKI